MAGDILSWRTTASVACVQDGAVVSVEAEGITEASDASLLELETTYALRRREMIRFLIHYGVDLVEAEDITQEVFLNALKTPERKRLSDHLFRWLLVCAKNMAFNRQKKEKREVLAPSALWRRWEETIGDGLPGADIRIQDRERWGRFYLALSQLNATEQQCVLLRCQGRTFREIGEAINVPLRSAIYTTSSALQKMQGILENA